MVTAAAVVLTSCGVDGSQSAVPGATSSTLPEVTGRTAMRQLIDRSIEDTMDQRWTRFVVTMGLEARDGSKVTRYRGAVDRTRRKGNERITYEGRGWLSVRAIRERAYVTSADRNWRPNLGGRAWLRVEPHQLPGVGSFEDLDLPTTVLWRVADRRDVERAGERVIDRRRLAMYRFSLPPGPKRVASGQEMRVRSLTPVKSDGERTVKGTVGIGSDGLVHFIELVTLIGPPSRGADAATAESAVRYQASLSGFDRPVRVVPPPASATADGDRARNVSGVVHWLQSRGD